MTEVGHPGGEQGLRAASVSRAPGAAAADDAGVPHDDVVCVAPARFVLEIPALTRGMSDRMAAVETIFGILARGVDG